MSGADGRRVLDYQRRGAPGPGSLMGRRRRGRGWWRSPWVEFAGWLAVFVVGGFVLAWGVGGL